ncbi:SRPBCC family protein [Haloechinothrix halophila]|uniref:SRPBCC family protein n=1 Tax=Haloechinothrix halophila TaxID=1069073 RepID=UPI0012F7B171|nr:SRPBCC family protein [Haloechinothrix halophila]
MSNVHQRVYDSDSAQLNDVIDQLADPEKSVWPPRWPQLILEEGLTIGSKGGHGRILYSVSRYHPGRFVEFRFDPSMGLRGRHSFEVIDDDDPNTTLFRHSIVAVLDGPARWRWPLMIRWTHDALIEDLFDQVGYSIGQPPQRPARWPVWVHVVRWLRGHGRAVRAAAGGERPTG